MKKTNTQKNKVIKPSIRSKHNTNQKKMAKPKPQNKKKQTREKLFMENHEAVLKIGIPYIKKLFEKDSNFQNIKVLKTKGYGNMLINDNIIMTCERDEFIYHEMIAHIPLFTHPKPETVLIIGGGDGGTAREVLKHKSVKKCTMVEIDSLVIKASKKYLPKIATAFNDSRLDLKIQDGAKFIKEQNNFFDIIIIDSSDPVGPSSVLFGKEFYQDAFKALKTDGLLTAQAGNFFYNLKTQKESLKMCQKIGFKKRAFYTYSNLTYPPGSWSFLFASKKYHPLLDLKKKAQFKMKLQYYNKEIHQSSFAMPEVVKKALKKHWKL